MCRAVPHVHIVPAGHTARHSGCRELFLCIGPLGEAGLKHGVKAKGSEQEPHEGKESESL